MEGIDTLNVTVVLQLVKVNVCHTELFALVNIRCTLEHVQAGGEHFCRNNAVFFRVVCKTGDSTRLIVVIEEKAVPCLAFQLILPFVHNMAEVSKLRFLIRPFPNRASYEIHMLKLEYHSKLGSFIVRIFLGFFDGNAGGLTDGEQIVMGEYATVHFLEKFVDTRTVAYIWGKIAI